MKKQMDLRWAQEQMDLWLELGVEVEEMRKEISKHRKEDTLVLDHSAYLMDNDEVVVLAQRIIRWTNALTELEVFAAEGPGYTVSELLEGYAVSIGKVVSKGIMVGGAYDPVKYLESQMEALGTFPKKIVVDFLLNFYPDPEDTVYTEWMKELYYGPCGKCFGRGGIVDWYEDAYGARHAVIRECPRCGE